MKLKTRRYSNFLPLLVAVLINGKAFGDELIVSAAASLTDVFTHMIEVYESENPSSEVLLNLGGSGALLQQIYKGAPVDVYASANMVLVNQAIERKALKKETVTVFTSNELVLIVPKKIEHGSLLALKDLVSDEVKRVAVSNYGVPVGRYTIDTLKNLGYWEVLKGKVINTMNVRQTLSYVLRGEVDAGFVYRTDAGTQPERVKIVEAIPTVEKITYPIGITESSHNLIEARKFLQFVLSTRGQEVLAEYGFSKP